MGEESTELVCTVRIRTSAKPGHGVDRVRQTLERVVWEGFGKERVDVEWEDKPGENFYAP